MMRIAKRMSAFLLVFMLFTLSATSWVQADANEEQATIQIYSVDQKAQPITGFVYEIIDSEGKTRTADMTEESFWEIAVPYGSYTIREMARPEGYRANPPLTVTLPYENPQGQACDVLKIYPKHHEFASGTEESSETPPPHSEETPLFPGFSPKTGEPKLVLFAAIALLISGILLFWLRRKKSEDPSDR